MTERPPPDRAQTATPTAEREAGRPWLRVTEIFHSIQGESTRAGLPCTFVRLTGCPLRCVWCDTEYAFYGGERMGLDGIVDRVREIGTPLVEITGGEPLVHPNAFVLADRLLDEGFTVLVETSGAVDVARLDPRVHKIMDLKCPGSGEASRNRWENLEHLTARDEVKFVVRDRRDYEWARDAIRERGLERRLREGELGALLISPVWDEIAWETLAGWILEDRLPVRLQLQLHKLIWGPDVKGV
ncbi:MAG: radical SAM protein [Gemmatimonadetes bacterium]|nr:radical SAM protein [Gemmatimonadota bacterium]NIR79788.1 radical SAM protein [Gemmatimonadota bacterium]NIT89806.1 radical SAM protein [Gemmatimonadota bacterium]NIU33592.1 radical SAM protein [Gemmatimonadota bacterium]NIV63925.1 radical SAM protein [Gemmatimonadota bacterium]